MNIDIILDKINDLYRKNFNTKPNYIEKLKTSGSNRLYFRIHCQDESIIATYNEDSTENDTFVYLQNFFESNNLPVPKLYQYFKNDNIYFQQDLGDITFYDYLQKLNHISNYEEILNYYKRIVDYLLLFQFSASNGLDFTKCYPVAEFNKENVLWDLYYFKYMFLRLSYANFNEKKLDDEFQKFAESILDADLNYFVYRDFQSRNIMIYNNNLYFIDFQGGRKGAYFYDIASLLYDSKAKLSHNLRESILSYYFNELSKKITVDENIFFSKFYEYVIFRILQALGAYGYRGLYEHKEHFILSIEPALNNILFLERNLNISYKYPYLIEILLNQLNNPKITKYFQNKVSSGLVVHIKSFSYKNGYPEDKTIHGGGFVFDCRYLPNPAKYEKYKYLTGKDNEVIVFMESFDEVRAFLNNVFEIIDSAINKYIEHNFEYLSVSFGCTGGQHRSVYFAEKLANHIKSKYSINVYIEHLNEKNWLIQA